MSLDFVSPLPSLRFVVTSALFDLQAEKRHATSIIDSNIEKIFFIILSPYKPNSRTNNCHSGRLFSDSGEISFTQQEPSLLK